MTTGRHEVLNLDAIKMENPYLRLGTDVSTLEKSIQTIGLIAPLIVNDENVLLAGARRWQALKNLGETEVPVIRVSKSNLEQELISIDENLVRKSLTNPEVEGHLLRAREIYCEMAEKDENFKATLFEKRKARLEENPDEAPVEEITDIKEVATEEFANDVSLKSGLSKSQVIKAMEREEKSGESLKEARKRGEVNVSQANEIIKLDEKDQEELIPHIAGRTVGELRKLVKEAKTVGVEEAIRKSEVNPHAREYNELLKSFKKGYKIAEALEIEGIEIEGPLRKEIQRYWDGLKEKMNALLAEDFSGHHQSFTPEYTEEAASLN
jgi:ParB family chromosome partitioning protein